MPPLTVQGFLEPLHSDHVLGQCEGFALGLNLELPEDTSTALPDLKKIFKKNHNHISSTLCTGELQLPRVSEKLLLISNVAFVTDGQEVQDQLGVLLEGSSYGAFVGLELDHIDHFVWRS